MAGAGPSYAPDDPTLPKPWKGLVDGNTGNLYFWNPETNVTQYQRPVAQLPSSPDLKKSEYVVSQQSSIISEGQEKHDINVGDNQYKSHANVDEHVQQSSIISSQGQEKHDTIGDNQFRNHVSIQEKVQQSLIPFSEGLKEHHTDNGDNQCRSCLIIEEKVQQSTIPYRHVSIDEKVRQSSIPSGEGLKEHHTDNGENQCGSCVNIEEKADTPFEGHNPDAYNIQCKGPEDEKEKSSEGKIIAASLVGKPACDSSRSLNSGSVPQPSKQSVDLYCKKHEIRVSGGVVPMPFMTFEATNFPRELLRAVRDAGFSAPTPIQAQTWPIALQRRDIIAVAKTGSGKTLGYLIPGFYHVKNLRRNNKMGPTVLVLSPTRELATQILDEAKKFGSSSAISCTCLYGGAPKGPQLAALARGVDIIVATPGRLNDILEMKRISLQQVSYLVLDEADRMLDMGFEPQIRKVVKEIPERRQTLMYTATWPKEVRKIATDLLTNPVQVNIGNVDELVANKSITQHVKVVDSTEKKQCLKQLLRSLQPGKTIIFCSTKRMCDMLAENLDEHFGAAAIHGDKSQEVRDNVLSDFRTGKSLILVATDVAARGLDVKDVRVVINYDFPTGIEDYVHRIGRTGRAGATGVAYTFFTDMDAKYASGLIKILEGAGQNVPPELRSMPSYGDGYGGGGRTGRQWGSGGGGRGNKWNGSGGGNQSNVGSWSSQSCSGSWSEKREKEAFGNNGMRARSRSPVKRAWG